MSESARVGSVLSVLLQAGDVIRFEYPRNNYRGVPIRWVRRVVRVTSIRDTGSLPLEAETILTNPLLRRGRVLVRGIDLAIHEERCFYANWIRRPQLVEEVEQTEEVYRVIRIRQDGREGVPVPCMRSVEARAYVAACNERTHLTGTRAEARELRLPCLTRDANGKVE